ncbi:MAG: hypothetical protein JWN03_4372 [Nocardia sp.]|uniref:DUF3089 domain-containing protein n=1 Tax=Nocardia sp. TaxID=1821 RepID=UPI00262E9495|nr:DUF3089 domain-containing protein [Nocardia sp.]MCU1644097.1 hypothetical protein [Nocardia sp.]
MRIRYPAIAALLFGTVIALITAFAAPPASAESDTTWLCQPGQANDPCGGRSGAPIDCFYVYPTASLQQSTNTNFDASLELREVARAQTEPFGANCNVWAPVYRQVTLNALFNPPAGGVAAARDLAYQDVERAWDDYLANHNGGRGVVLIGHSQGSRMLRTLIRNRIDGKPVQSQLVSALLIGGDVLVPKGAKVGGDFTSIPACTDPAQTGCVVAYSSFTRTPPSNTRFGLPPQVPDTSEIRGTLPFGPDYEVLCTNPASLRDNASAPIHSIVAGRQLNGLNAQCTDGDEPHVLLVDGPGAALLPAVPDATWGTHLLDINLAQHDLLDLVATQTTAYQHH